MQWKHTKGISVVHFYRLNQRSLFLLSPAPSYPSIPPSPQPFRVSLLCVGRSSTLAVHVFTNVSEYLIVIIPLSSALRRLSVSKAELHSCGNCYCYFKKLYDYLFWSCLSLFFFGRSALFQVTEDKFQGWCMKLKGWREKRIFYQTLGYANIMMVDYCFYRVKPTAVILCSYFPFSLLLCCDFNLIAFL